MKTIQPRKNRLRQLIAPMHRRAAALSAHLSKELRKQLKKRSALVKKGDKVKILRGEFRGLSGAVTKVNYTSQRVFIEGVVAKKQSGKERQVPIHASNLVITEKVAKKA